MTPKDLNDYINFRAHTDDNAFTVTEKKLLIGIYMDEFAREILKVNEDYFGMPLTTPLVADQREYPFEAEILNQIKMIEAKLDGSNFIRLGELDLNRYQRATTESVIILHFQNLEGEAFYDIFRGSLWLYSGTITDVAGGLKIWSFTYPKHLTDLTVADVDMAVAPSTSDHGFPRAFHELLGRRVSIAYKESQDEPIPLDETERKFEFDFNKAISSIRGMNLDRDNTAEIPHQSDRGNEGQDY